MTIKQFSSATHYVQRTMVKFHGNFLLKKNTGSLFAMLYEIDGFYVEVSYYEAFENISVIKCFTIDEIDDYLAMIDIGRVTELL